VQQVGFAQAHIAVHEERIEQRLRRRECARHLLRRGVGEAVVPQQLAGPRVSGDGEERGAQAVLPEQRPRELPRASCSAVTVVGLISRALAASDRIPIELWK
jgi:hypothetical protein